MSIQLARAEPHSSPGNQPEVATKPLTEPELAKYGYVGGDAQSHEKPTIPSTPSSELLKACVAAGALFVAPTRMVSVGSDGKWVHAVTT